MNNAQRTRSVLLGLLVVVLLIIVIAGVGAPAWGGNCGAGPEGYAPRSARGKYSLYGWRTNPPPNYPQNTFNTPYDVVMRNCGRWCNQTQDPRECQSNCRKMALRAEGIGRGFPPTAGHVDALTRSLSLPAAPGPGVSHGDIIDVEPYSPFVRGSPSHILPRQVATNGTNDPPCFYF